VQPLDLCLPPVNRFPPFEDRGSSDGVEDIRLAGKRRDLPVDGGDRRDLPGSRDGLLLVLALVMRLVVCERVEDAVAQRLAQELSFVF
jgi:hypothetical protein